MSLNTMQEKIAKLLAQANDREGTAEGKTFLEKAMQLMAQYGISESEVSTETIDTTMGKTTINISGMKYIKQQRSLINRISHALNCYCLYSRDPYTNKQVMYIYGREIDRERVNMLFSAASPSMIASAMKSIPAGTYRIKLARLSHMEGYASAIQSSLTNHETNAREHNGESKEVMLADATAARDFCMEDVKSMGMRIAKSAGSRINRNNFNNGYREGSKFDTGSKSRLNNKRALNA